MDPRSNLNTALDGCSRAPKIQPVCFTSYNLDLQCHQHAAHMGLLLRTWDVDRQCPARRQARTLRGRPPSVAPRRNQVTAAGARTRLVGLCHSATHMRLTGVLNIGFLSHLKRAQGEARPRPLRVRLNIRDSGQARGRVLRGPGGARCRSFNLQVEALLLPLRKCRTVCTTGHAPTPALPPDRPQGTHNAGEGRSLRGAGAWPGHGMCAVCRMIPL